MTVAHRLLLVEDDRDQSTLLSRALSSAGYDVTAALDGHTALHFALTRAFDVMIIDRGLPAIEGVDLIARLRAKGVSAPALILSARGSTADRIEGLDAGAEDYLSKPYDLDELLARLRALLRRHADSSEELPIPGGRLIASQRSVLTASGDFVTLTERECELLRVLAVRSTQAFSREDLLIRVFEDSDAVGVIDTYVHYLRRKLGKGVIRTVRGVGYRLGAP